MLVAHWLCACGSIMARKSTYTRMHMWRHIETHGRTHVRTQTTRSIPIDVHTCMHTTAQTARGVRTSSSHDCRREPQQCSDMARVYPILGRESSHLGRVCGVWRRSCGPCLCPIQAPCGSRRPCRTVGNQAQRLHASSTRASETKHSVCMHPAHVRLKPSTASACIQHTCVYAYACAHVCMYQYA
jgi:hypothetical protein